MKKLFIGALAGLFALAGLAVTSGDGGGVAIQTREFSLNNDSVTLNQTSGTNAYGSLTLGNLPEGLIVIHGAVLDVGGVLALNAGGVTNTTFIKAGVGFAAATSPVLTGTVVDVVGQVVSSTGWTNRVTKVSGVSTDVATSDGTAGAKTLYLNFATASSSTGGTLSANGKVKITFSNIGDK
jgi:hypothetical protein